MSLLLILAPVPAHAELSLNTPRISMHDALTQASYLTLPTCNSISWELCWTSSSWSISKLKQSEQDCILAFSQHHYHLAGSYELSRAINLEGAGSEPKDEFARCLIFTAPDQKDFCIIVLLNDKGEVGDIQHYSASPREHDHDYTPPMMEYQLIRK
ncbi:MAG: hypothetical protein R3Y56_04960 [Akkermansia sp.]